MSNLSLPGLLVAFGLFLNLGFWSMSHNPIHLVLFIFITCLIITIFLTMGLNFTSLRRKHRPYRGLST